VNIAVTRRIEVVAAPSGDFGNLLQIDASALHPLELGLDDELRPLAHVGLTAIRRAADSTQAQLPANTVDLTRSIT
jgi:hypothetical protein